MAKVKIGMTSDDVLRIMGKPIGPSQVFNKDDPEVVWPYESREIVFQYRDNAWRVVSRNGR